ncbi:hypothetical protein C8T65DRAFT_551116, partial [Cerioporus squamosus]
SAAQDTPSSTRQSLTLGDWLNVFRFIDDHPHMTQNQVVKHFGSLKTGRLVFTQGALSKNLKRRGELEKQSDGCANAVSMKRRRVVTAPEVDTALEMWTKNMEARGETYTGGMLVEKRRRFEEQLGIPEERRLKGQG